MLTCFRTRRRLSAYLDGALDGAAAASAERHLAECAACQREVETLQRTKALLQRALKAAAVSGEPDWTDFWPGILRGIETARRVPAAAPRRAWSARWALGGALLAALLVAATLWRWQDASPPVVLESPVLVSSADTEQPDASVMVYHAPERDMTVVWVFGDE